MATRDDAQPLPWSSPITTEQQDRVPAADVPRSRPAAPVPEPARAPNTRSAKREGRGRTKAPEGACARSHRHHAKFLAGLPRVRRALANIPTYMIFDDHDVTDDFFLNPMWRDRVLTTALGQTILHNAMVTYALFQDWGNDPLRYDSGLPAELRTRALELFPAGATNGPGAGTVRPARPALRPRPAQPADGRRPVRRRDAADHVALHGRRPDAPRDRARQPDPAQLRLAARAARQRVDRRPGRPDPAAAAARRSQGPRGDRPSPGHRVAGARRSRRPAGLPGLRPRRRDRGRRGSLVPQPLRATRDDRHQPGRHRGLGVRRGHVRAPARAARAVPAGGAPVGRRPLLGRHGDELLARSGGPAGPDRPVHVERLEERDADDDHRRRPQRRVRPADDPGQPRHRAHRLGAPAGGRRAAPARTHAGRPGPGDAVAARLDARHDPDLGLARRQRPRSDGARSIPPRRAGSTRRHRPTGAGGSRRCSTTGPTPTGRSRSGRWTSTRIRSTPTSPIRRRS